MEKITVRMLGTHSAAPEGHTVELFEQDQVYDVPADLASTMLEHGWAEEVGEPVPDVSGEIEIVEDIDWPNPEGTMRFSIEKGQVKKVPDEVPLDAAQVFVEKGWARPAQKKGNALVKFFKKLGGN